MNPDATYRMNQKPFYTSSKEYPREPGACSWSDWFIEGDATYFQVNQFPGQGCVTIARQMAASGTLASLQGDGPSIRGSNALEGYRIGCAFFKTEAPVVE